MWARRKNIEAPVISLAPLHNVGLTNQPLCLPSVSFNTVNRAFLQAYLQNPLRRGIVNLTHDVQTCTGLQMFHTDLF
ncbi:Uncharacterised protein [Corynebacterium ulcerans]|nr:Uncharacterised protein [Corynebacterium ulcerans]